MCAGVGKSGSPISRCTTLRPSASSARALTNTSKADSTPMRLIRSANFMKLRFPKVRDAAALFDLDDAVIDRDAAAQNPAGDAAARVEGHDGRLVGRVLRKRLGRGVNHRFGVDNAASHTAPRMLTTHVAPEPPRFSARPMRLRATCRSPASLRICCI